MSQMIIDLWNGNLAPFEQCGKGNSELLELASLMARNREKLGRELTQAQMEAFQKYVDCSDAYLLRMNELAFCEGFSTAGKLLSEAFSVRT